MRLRGLVQAWRLTPSGIALANWITDDADATSSPKSRPARIPTTTKENR